jgi:class 3 adenylate cyclase
LAREQRRLAAIMAADVVGYSRLMGRDESGTLVRLHEHRKRRFEPTLARYGGRLVKLTGDGALVEFASAVDALGAAIEFQQAMAEANQKQAEDTQIVFRVGLHLGDLIVDGDDLYGDGVNVAARLEAEAHRRAGSSSRVRCAKRSRAALGRNSMPWANSLSRTSKGPSELSIAVLPFQNMSGPCTRPSRPGYRMWTASSRERSLSAIQTIVRDGSHSCVSPPASGPERGRGSAMSRCR